MLRNIQVALSLLLACLFALQPVLPALAQTGLPGAFGKVAPSNGTTTQPTSFTLRWNLAPGATSYRYCISTVVGCQPSGEASFISVGNVTSKAISGLAPNTTYYWQVRAYNGSGSVAANGTSAWWSFTTMAAPAPFDKVGPVNGATGQPTSVTLSWAASAGASSYSYCVSTVIGCQPNGEASFTPISGTSVTVSGLAPNTTYYWQARAVNSAGSLPANGEGAWWSFTTGALPGAFSKVSPANTVANQPTSITLRWNAAPGATGYAYCVSTVVGCQPNGEASFIPINGTSVTVSGLTPGTTYYWQVRAVNAIGSTVADEVGAWWSFTTAALPGTFGKATPINNATGQPVNITLRWNAAVGAKSYRYCVSTVVGCQPNGEASFIPINGTSVQVSLAPNSSYYWQVRAYNNAGNIPADGEGAWWKLSTTGAPPSDFSKLNPVNGSTGQATNVTLNWQPAPGATGYRYCVSTTVGCQPNGDASFIDVAGTSITLALNPGTAYYWQVKAVNATGQTVANGVGQWWSFTTTGNQIAGALKGELGVNEAGAATYNVPLTMPPGTANVAPSLAVAYDSRGTNSLLGWGWSLSGLSLIGRCPTTLALHGSIDPVDFDSVDQFCLDGQMLIAVQGAYGADETTYHTENQSFARVVSYGRAGGGPQHFKAWTKTGLIMEYGATEDSRIEASGRADALYWALTRVQDTRGNYLTVSYGESADGESYPTRISYTGNSSAGLASYAAVDFVYENRPDVAISSVAGAQVRLARRLQALRVSIDNALVREYRFGYNVSPATGRSRLTTLTECAGDGTCLPATVFDWVPFNDAEHNFNGVNSGMWTGHSGGVSNNRVGDFNGDGRTDIAGYSTSRSQWHVCYATGAGFSCAFQSATTEGLANTLSGDFNGDGRTDLIGRTATVVGTGRQWNVCLATGSGFTCGLWLGQLALTKDSLVGDFDGDGRTDLAGYSGTSTWAVCLSTGTGFNCAPWRGHAGGTGNNVAADLNGDGRTDLAGYDALRAQWHVCLSTGTTFHCGYWSGHRGGTSGNVTGDFNGDGMGDFAGYDTSLAQWDVCLSTGAGFSCNYRTIHQGGADNNAVGDFNGDGRTDLAGYTGSGGLWHVCLATDSGFNCGARYWSGHAGGATMNVTGDFNGDGKSDLMGYTGTGGQWHVTLAAGTVPDLVSTITDGHGALLGISYRPLNDTAIYTRDSDAVYPRRDVTGPMYVVATQSRDNGIGGRWQTNYLYTGLKVNLRGRGFLGFRTIRATDSRSGISNTQYYAQEGLYKALVWKVEQQLADGTLIARTEHGWDALVVGQVFYPYVRATRVERYETDGTPISVSTTTTTIDAYGNPTRIEERFDDGFVRTTVNAYDNDAVRWLLGLLTRSEVTAQAPGQPAQTRVSTAAYDPASGQLMSETIEPGTPLAWTKSYEYDLFGNVVRATQSGADVAAFTHTTEYNPKGRFVTRVVNPLGHSEARTNDTRFGALTSLTGPNGLTTSWTYDAYGRQTLERRPDGTETTTSFQRCAAGCPARGVYMVRVEATGAPTNTTYFDLLDRPIRVETRGYDGRAIYVDTEYGQRGNRARVSNPYFAGEQPVWTVYEYDGLGRAIALTMPDSSRTTTSYRGLTTVVADPLGQTQTRVVNTQGWLLRSADTIGTAITYTYDSFGNLQSTVDPAGNTTSSTYDARGRQLTLSVPGAGTSSFRYNAAGQLVWQRNGRGQETQLRYDLLGRLSERLAPEGSSLWTYDTQPQGIGKPASVEGPNGFREDYSYDALGRHAQTATTIDGTTYRVTTAYDTAGRVVETAYPTGFRTRNVYNPNGYLAEVRDVGSNALFWKADTLNAAGQVTRETLGNGLQTVRGYDPLNARLATLTTGTAAAPGAVQNLAYSFDRLGNLTSRADRNRALSESFGYDALNRLLSAQVAGQPAVTVTYDALGNILTKSDVGSYSYGESGPHAVTGVAGAITQSYSYDADGNRISSAGGNVSYTSTNKPTSITEASQALSFSYAPDDRLFRKISSTGGITTTTYYVSGLYEVEQSGSQSIHRHRIVTGGTQVLYVTRSNGAPQTLWVHTDHLGSVDAVTDAGGQVVERQSFDAWGRPRATDWRSLATVQASLVNRGFTNHEQLFAVGLVHMGGRVYDPTIGRFLSQDPVVQAPDNLQNLNRYSYVLNRPLSLTDPSGYSWLGDLGEKIGGFFKDNWKSLAVMAVTAIIAGLPGFSTWAQGLIGPAGSLTSKVVGAFVVGSASGFVGGTVGSLLYDASLSKALHNGLREGLSSGLFKALGVTGPRFMQLPMSIETNDRLSKALVSGVGRGLMAQWRGQSFASGAITSIVGDLLGDASTKRGLWGLLGKIWNAPNTIVGLAWGLIGVPFGARVIPGNNAIQFLYHPFMPSGMTLGNTISYVGLDTDPRPEGGPYTYGDHERQHTFQGEQLGLLYLPSNIIGLAASFVFDGAIDGRDGHGATNWNEVGPQCSPPRIWGC